MRNQLIPALVVLAVVLGMAGTLAAQPQVERVSVPFSDPARPGMLKIGLTYGSITVKAHAAEDVVFEIRARGQDDKDHDHDERTSDGMFVIANTGLDFTVSEEDNIMELDADSWNRGLIVEVLVPADTSLNLSTVNSGHIVVDGVSGELELSNVNGRITAENVSGSVVAETVNGSVKVTLVSVTPGKSMAFSTLNGSIDVTFPEGVKADLRLDPGQGKIYSDFEIALDRTPMVVRDERKGERYEVKVERKVRGTINGGGAEMHFETFNGSIYIRKW